MFLSYVLRHHPESVGVALDQNGWVDVSILLAGIAAHGSPITRAFLDKIVSTNSKRRFAFSLDGSMIRASQGHSAVVVMDLGLPISAPPILLYHGTVESVLPSIRRNGLLPMSRAYVHLSADIETAMMVGSRKAGNTVVLVVQAAEMASAGFNFFKSENDVWLTAVVPPESLHVTNLDVGSQIIFNTSHI